MESGAPNNSQFCSSPGFVLGYKSVSAVSTFRIGSLSFDDDDDDNSEEKDEKSTGEVIVSAASKSEMGMPESSFHEEKEGEEMSSSASRKGFGCASLLNSPLSSSSCKMFSVGWGKYRLLYCDESRKEESEGKLNDVDDK